MSFLHVFFVTFRYNIAESQASWIGHGYQQHEEFGLRFRFIFLALAITAQNQRKSHYGKQFHAATTVSVAEASTAGGVDAKFEYTKEHHIDQGTVPLSGIPPIHFPMTNAFLAFYGCRLFCVATFPGILLSFLQNSDDVSSYTSSVDAVREPESPAVNHLPTPTVAPVTKSSSFSKTKSIVTSVVNTVRIWKMTLERIKKSGKKKKKKKNVQDFSSVQWKWSRWFFFWISEQYFERVSMNSNSVFFRQLSILVLSMSPFVFFFSIFLILQLKFEISNHFRQS